MKVPPKRKGNNNRLDPLANLVAALNESPSEKEGKSVTSRYRARYTQNPQ